MLTTDARCPRCGEPAELTEDRRWVKGHTIAQRDPFVAVPERPNRAEWCEGGEILLRAPAARAETMSTT